MPSVRLDGPNEMNPTAPELREKDISRTVCDFLKAQGWRLIRMNVSTVNFRGQWVNYGEKGMPDYLAVYYLHDGFALLLWLEFKRQRGGRLSAEQVAWSEKERRDGAVVFTVSDIDHFRQWYDERFDTKGSPVKAQRRFRYPD